MDLTWAIRYMVLMATMIDTLKTSKAFEDAGFAKTQADMLAVALAEATSASREDLVTKDYLRAQLAELRSEMMGLKSDIIRWLLGSQVALVVILGALANFTKTFG